MPAQGIASAKKVSMFMQRKEGGEGSLLDQVDEADRIVISGSSRMS